MIRRMHATCQSSLIKIRVLLTILVIAVVVAVSAPMISLAINEGTSEGVVIVADCTPVVDAPNIPWQVYIDNGDTVTIILR